MSVASILGNPEEARAYLEFLTPEPMADGTEPEDRLVHCGMSWERYLAFDKGTWRRPFRSPFLLSRRRPRNYDDFRRARTRQKVLAGFMETYFDEIDFEIVTRGQATMRLMLEQAGAEPDESWCIGEARSFPISYWKLR